MTVSHNGQQHVLRTPADLPDFCAALNLGQIDLPDWYSDFLQAPLERSPPSSTLSTPDKRLFKKSIHSHSGGSKVGTPQRQADAARDQEDY